jgi:hypothetical protein
MLEFCPKSENFRLEAGNAHGIFGKITLSGTGTRFCGAFEYKFEKVSGSLQGIFGGYDHIRRHFC